jgi:hypothetical protein
MRQKLNDIVLCIDFDATIAHRDAFPKIGKPLDGAVEAINKLYNEGYFIIVWTCRSGMHQLEAEQYLLDNGIPYDKVNSARPKELIQFNNEDTRKVWATAYIDDSSIEWKVKGMPHWSEIYKLCEELAPHPCIPEHKE